MPTGKSSTNLGAIVSIELKERLKLYAGSKHWSMSQAVAILLTERLDQIDNESKDSVKQAKKKWPVSTKSNRHWHEQIVNNLML